MLDPLVDLVIGILKSGLVIDFALLEDADCDYVCTEGFFDVFPYGFINDAKPQVITVLVEM